MLEQRLMTSRILWGALLVAVGLYAFVLIVSKPPVPDPAPDPMMVPLFGFVALSTAVISFVVPRIAMKPGLLQLKLPLADIADPNAPAAFNQSKKGFQDPEAAVLRAFPIFQTGLVLRCALSEAVALLGFVLGFLGFGMLLAAPFFVAGALLIALRFPTKAAIQRDIEAAYGVAF